MALTRVQKKEESEALKDSRGGGTILRGGMAFAVALVGWRDGGKLLPFTNAHKTAK